MKKLAIIGDFNPNSHTHQATNQAIFHSSQFLNKKILYDWISTDDAENNFSEIIQQYTAFWIAPGLHKNMNGTLRIIEYARRNIIPTLGTCGGFQHMIIEFARNVLDIEDAQHAEYNPDATHLVINSLTCDIRGKILEIKIDPQSKTNSILTTDTINEKYYCNYGLNPMYQAQIDDHGFKIVGTDAQGGARILELQNHPFFVATLFVPQDNSTMDRPNKLVTAFLNLLD